MKFPLPLVMWPCSLIALLQSCVSISSLQIARTLPPNQASMAVAAGTTSTVIPNKSDDPDSRVFEESIESFKVPVLEGSLRYGLLEKLEVGAKISFLPPSRGADIKYQFLGTDSAFAMSLGFGVTQSAFATTSDVVEDNDPDTPDTDVTWQTEVWDLAIPVYLSYDIFRHSTIYLNPRFVSRTSNSHSSNDSRTRNTPMLGMASGLAVHWFFAEYSLASEMGQQSKQYQQQIMIGLRFGYEKFYGYQDEPAPENKLKTKSKKKTRME